nr:unnamed protein product [Haemonchus contortus]
MEDESFTDITTTKSLASFTISTDNETSERLKKQKESLASKQNSRARVPSWYASDVKEQNEEKAVQTSTPKTPTAPRTPKPSIRLRSGNEKNVEHSEESSETNVSPIVDSPPKSSLWSRWGGGSSANPKWKGSNGSIPMTPTLSDGIGFKDTKYKPKDSSQEPKRVIWRDIYAEVIPNTSCFHSQRGDAHEAKVVLNQVSGYADPGQLTYIMGTSGSGKTTLLNILTQKRDDSLRVYGDIAINDCLLEAGDMKKISAYVQHEDLFITNVTVQEHLMFAARLRAHAKKTDDERKEIVEGVIQAMNLGNCRNTKIGGALQKNLSGGERKRLAFATEILADPSILFCDEPTSGLDSAMALRVALALKMLASKGKTVISTIHQPSSQVYEMADRLILLTHGQITYQGNASQVGDFFSSCGYPSPKFTSLPDHFIKVLSKDDDITEEEYTNRIKHLVDSYEASEEGKLAHHMTHMFTVTSTEQKARLIPGSEDKYSASWFAQLWWLFLRSSKIMLRDRQGFLTRLTKTIIISFISGLIYFNTKFTKDTLMNHKGAAIHAVSDMSYIYLYLSIYVLVNDLPAVIREYQANTYAPSAYFLAVVLADSVQYLIHPTIYSLIIYLMAGYSRSFSQYLLFNLLNITVANVSTSVAYAAASICGRLTIAVIFVPMVINSSLIFAGFFIDLRTIPVYFAVLPHLSWFKYAYEAYMIVLLKPIEEIDGCPSENPYDATVCSAKNGVEVLLSLGFHPGFYLVNFTILLIFIIFIRGIALIAFSIRVRRS